RLSSFRARVSKPVGDEVEGLVPGSAAKLSLSLSAGPDARVQKPRRPVQMLGKAADLRADVALGQRVDPGAADRDDATVRDGDVEAARVRAVEGTRARLVDPRRRLSVAVAEAHADHPTMRSTVSTAMGWYPGRARR